MGNAIVHPSGCQARQCQATNLWIGRRADMAWVTEPDAARPGKRIVRLFTTPDDAIKAAISDQEATGE